MVPGLGQLTGIAISYIECIHAAAATDPDQNLMSPAALNMHA
jgi:hypothetical protein